MCTYLHEQSKAMRSVGGPRGRKRASSRATRSKTSMGMLRRGEVDDCMDGRVQPLPFAGGWLGRLLPVSVRQLYAPWVGRRMRYDPPNCCFSVTSYVLVAFSAYGTMVSCQTSVPPRAVHGYTLPQAESELTVTSHQSIRGLSTLSRARPPHRS